MEYISILKRGVKKSMRDLIEEYGGFLLAVIGMLPIFIFTSYIYSDKFNTVISNFISTITCSGW